LAAVMRATMRTPRTKQSDARDLTSIQLISSPVTTRGTPGRSNVYVPGTHAGVGVGVGAGVGVGEGAGVPSGFGPGVGVGVGVGWTPAGAVAPGGGVTRPTGSDRFVFTIGVTGAGVGLATVVGPSSPLHAKSAMPQDTANTPQVVDLLMVCPHRSGGASSSRRPKAG
jgi:hypothetical protein